MSSAVPRATVDVARLVLASASPRRRALLAGAGFDFDVIPSTVDETLAAGETAIRYATRLAVEKALDVAGRATTRDAILGADTIVVCDGVVYGKPSDHEDAVRMLETLVGRSHVVITGWALIRRAAIDTSSSGFARSVVRMREASRSEILAYVAGGEPMDKAGAYAAQGEGRRFISAVLGALDNVIGLPMDPVLRALAAHGLLPRTGARA